MDEITSISDLQTLVREATFGTGDVDWKKYGDVKVIEKDGLLLFNYTEKAVFANRWNFFELVSRGLIVDKRTGEIVARPFDKFFNWGEGGRMTKAPLGTVSEKMDGSLGILYRTEEGFRIATRGSFDSDQALWATNFLNKNYSLWGLNYRFTLMFEIIYPENRVVVDYGGLEGLVLLAIRDRFTGEYLSKTTVQQIALRYGLKTNKYWRFQNAEEIAEKAKTLGTHQEGWVAEFGDGQRFKFKGDEYLKLHRLISELTFKTTLRAHQTGHIEAIRSVVPDEFLNEFNDWVAEIDVTIMSITSLVNRVFAHAPTTSRKDFALWVHNTNPALAAYLFAKYDGKDIKPLIYKTAFKDRATGDEPEKVGEAA